MEFPNSGQFGVSPNSSFDAAKSFLDNERGDTNEIVSNKKIEVKDFISEQSDNVNKFTDGENLNSSNMYENTLKDNDLENNKKSNNKDVKPVTSTEEEKFNDSVSKMKNEASASEEIRFIDPNDGKKESEEGEKDEWMDILGSGQLMKKTIKPGIPDSRPQKADICIITVTGKLEDGTIFEQFNSLEVNLGDNETIQGLDFALTLMDQGEEAEVIVASRFGYGSLGFEPLVPSDATLYYNVTLEDVKPEPLINTLGIKERIAIGCRKKERGNWWYSRDEHTLAIHSYRRALDYLDDTVIPGKYSDEEMHQLLEERLKTYNNLGASQLKISAFDAALLSIDQVLNCQPKNVKALFRKAKILKEKGELSKSIEIIRQVLAIEPETKAFQKELALLLAAQRKDNSKQRDLYKRMMGTNVQDNEANKKKKSPTNALKYVAFSLAVAVIGVIAYRYRL